MRIRNVTEPSDLTDVTTGSRVKPGIPGRRRRMAISMIMLLLLATLIPTGMSLWAGSEIASPARRKLMDYHRGILDDPASCGIRIETFTASDRTPCLVVTPSGSPGKRGSILRKQLADQHIALAEFGTIKGTLVLVHGRKGRKEDYLPIAERFCSIGFRCVIPDLPAHGDHPGETATFGLREAAIPERVLREASVRFAYPAKPAGLLGLSMGGSVAMHAAGEANAPWQALVVIASFDSLASTIHSQACGHIGNTLGPLWANASGSVFQHKTGIPIRDIQPHRIANTVTIPTLIAHGTSDPVIPLASGRRLFNALPASTTKQWVEIPNADHDNVLVTDFPIYATMSEWMLRHVR